MSKKQQGEKTEQPQENPDIQRGKMLHAIKKRGIDEFQWRALCETLFPGSRPESVLLAIDYCKARNLDVMKKPCHIVGMSVWDARKKEYVWQDVVMPGIYEYRTTAQKTGDYMGQDEAIFSEDKVEHLGLTAPDWCKVTVYRWHEKSGTKASYTAKLWLSETASTDKDGKPTRRWRLAPRQMLEKCTEAAALRKAFPDELGGTHTVEEMDGRTIDSGKSYNVKPTVSEPEEIGQQITMPEILQLAHDKGLDEMKLCQALKIGSMDEVPLKQYAEIQNWLNSIKVENENPA